MKIVSRIIAIITIGLLLVPTRAVALLEDTDVDPLNKSGDPEDHKIFEEADVGFDPQYGAGNDYDAFTATLTGDSVIVDADMDNSDNDERCSADEEGAVAAILAELNIAIALGTLCDALPSTLDVPIVCEPNLPFAQEICYGVLTVVVLAAEAVAIRDAQCVYQDSTVDGAEIEAAYENSKLVLSAEMEKRLIEDVELVSYFLPAMTAGQPTLRGRAEEVQHLVDVRLKQFENAYTASGALPGDAQTQQNFNDAEAAFSAGKSALSLGNVRLALRKFMESYQFIANSGP